MSTNKILCLGDGFAHGHIWPEWPQILQALMPNKHVIEITGVGSGHEFLISGLLDQDPQDCDVLFQWPNAERFDKLIEDQYWTDRARHDPVYFFNTYDSPHGIWWLSSASQDTEIRHYHDVMIQHKQHSRRYDVAKILIKAYLENKKCRYYEFSNHDQEKFLQQSYPSIRGNQIQPSPISHFYYVVKKIVPQMDYQVDTRWQMELERRIKNHVWVPFDADREHIWQEMSK